MPSTQVLLAAILSTNANCVAAEDHGAATEYISAHMGSDVQGNSSKANRVWVSIAAVLPTRLVHGLA